MQKTGLLSPEWGSPATIPFLAAGKQVAASRDMYRQRNDIKVKYRNARSPRVFNRSEPPKRKEKRRENQRGGAEIKR